MGKGHVRRPAAISAAEEQARWDAIFATSGEIKFIDLPAQLAALAELAPNR